MGRLLGTESLAQMRRYWINQQQIFQDVVHFSGEQFHHIFDVCRQTVGQHFEVITDDSRAYVVEVVEVAKKTARAKIIESREIKPLARPHIRVALSLSRYAVMDSTIERCVELGVSHVHPFVSEYSFIRKTTELPEGKYDRWQKIIVSATQQSGRGELMKIHPVTSLEALLVNEEGPANLNAGNWCLFAYEGKTQTSIKDEIERLRAQTASLPDNVWILVGSEGGFSRDEVRKIEDLGLHPVTLGRQILRVETACLTLVSVLKYQFGLMQ